MVEYYAHSLQNRPTSEWEPLKKHLQEVAELAATFAGAFGAEGWGRLAGLWHDLGKYSSAFQAYLRQQNGMEAEGRLQFAQRRSHHGQAV